MAGDGDFLDTQFTVAWRGLCVWPIFVRANFWALESPQF